MKLQTSIVLGTTCPEYREVTLSLNLHQRGVLVHAGRDDAKGWSAGCILAVPNEPVVNKKSGTNPRNNTIDESKDFCIQIKDWVIQRETEIKKANPSIKKVTKKIIITKNF